MVRFALLSIALITLVLLPRPVQADNTIDLLKEAIQLLESGEKLEAREVVAIALDQIDHSMLDIQAAVFPQKVGIFTRGEVTTQKSMGVDVTRTVYEDPEGNQIEVQVIGGGGGVVGNIANLTAQFGGGRKVRYHGRSGTLMEESGDVTLNLQLKNGKNFMATTDDVDRNTVENFVEEFPVVELDESGS